MDQFEYKGASIINLDLSSISESLTRALNITIDWGDGSDREIYKRALLYNYKEFSIFPEILEGKIGGSVLNAYEHIYIPADTHVKELTAQVLINFDNSTYTKIVQPITLIQESYYDNIKEFSVNSVGVHDDSLFSIVNFQSKSTGQTWPGVYVDNSYLVTTVLPPEAPPAPPYNIETVSWFNGGGIKTVADPLNLNR